MLFKNLKTRFSISFLLLFFFNIHIDRTFTKEFITLYTLRSILFHLLLYYCYYLLVLTGVFEFLQNSFVNTRNFKFLFFINIILFEFILHVLLMKFVDFLIALHCDLKILPIRAGNKSLFRNK